MELAPEPSKHKLASTREYIDQYVAGGQIKLIDVIECGSFGEIYLGQRVGSGEHFAVKIIRPEKRGTGDSILREFGFLSKLEGKGLFPKCRIEYSNMNALKNTVLIMQHLGPSLYDVYRACQKKFSVPTMAYVAVEILKRFKELHCQGIVHRDIKPQNFCLGGENLASIYLIDFGLSKEYRQENGTLVPEDTPAGFVGTPRYASTNSHAKKLQTRRDDVESLGYMMVFLLVGSLPWQSVKTKDKKKKHEELFRIKSAINVEQLCKGLPTVFADLINEARDLEFEEEPPYDYYIKEFGKLSCPAAALDWANLPEFVAYRSKYNDNHFSQRVAGQPNFFAGPSAGTQPSNKIQDVGRTNIGPTGPFAFKSAPQNKRQRDSDEDSSKSLGEYFRK